MPRLIYIGVTLLGYPEKEVWRMTAYKILTLFRIHREFNPDRFKPDPMEEARQKGIDPIDIALGGL